MIDLTANIRYIRISKRGGKVRAYFVDETKGARSMEIEPWHLDKFTNAMKLKGYEIRSNV